MSFFFLFTQQQKERKSTKKKEKPKLCSNILTSIHSFGCVSMFGYAESLQPRKLPSVKQCSALYYASVKRSVAKCLASVRDWA